MPMTRSSGAGGSVGIVVSVAVQPGDIGEIIRLHGVTYNTERGWDHTFEAYVAEPIGRFIIEFDPARDRIWIARRGEEIVGCVAIKGEADGSAQLRWFLVHPTTRGSGLGRKLLSQAIDFARSSGAREVFLWTTDDLDAARHLYTQAGFALAESVSGRRWGADVTEQRYLLKF
jgi:GNAT superfamily N-acetyltransferase